MSAVVALAVTAALVIKVPTCPCPETAGADAQSRVVLDSTLRGLEPLVGSWGAPPNTPRVPANHVVHLYEPMVGGKSLRMREGFPAGRSDDAELDGMVFWNVATERIEFVAVAGKGTGQGRFFSGEYRVLPDGAVERVYDVFYRTLADTPGEELGGARRRYREVYRLAGRDSVDATLEWWLRGEWRPYGPGRYVLLRR